MIHLKLFTRFQGHGTSFVFLEKNVLRGGSERQVLAFRHCSTTYYKLELMDKLEQTKIIWQQILFSSSSISASDPRHEA